MSDDKNRIAAGTDSTRRQLITGAAVALGGLALGASAHRPSPLTIFLMPRNQFTWNRSFPQAASVFMTR